MAVFGILCLRCAVAKNWSPDDAAQQVLSDDCDSTAMFSLGKLVGGRLVLIREYREGQAMSHNLLPAEQEVDASHSRQIGSLQRNGNSRLDMHYSEASRSHHPALGRLELGVRHLIVSSC